jgi:hypothetical protein
MKMIKVRMSKGVAVAALLSVCVMAWGFSANAQLTNLARGKTAVASSSEAGLLPGAITDGDTISRWGSNYNLAKPDSAWIYIDFGYVATFDSISIWWEHSHAKEYLIQISNIPSSNDQGWKTLFHPTVDDTEISNIPTASLHRNFKLTTPASARYLKIRGILRHTAYGYSIHELQVFNTLGSNLALHKTAVASSSNGGAVAGLATDGIMFNADGSLNFNSRWENNYGGRANDSLKGCDWIYVDLGAKYLVSYIAIFWEHSHSGNYVLQAWTKDAALTAADTLDANWTFLVKDTSLTYSKPPDFCQTAFAVSPTKTQYVRMHSYDKAKPYAEFAWGISIFEFEVYGTSVSTSTIPESMTKPAATSNLSFSHSASGVSIKSSASSLLSTDILSPSGQLIRHLSGSEASFWNYKDSFGRNVRNGTYLLKVTSEGKTIQEKIIVYR